MWMLSKNGVPSKLRHSNYFQKNITPRNGARLVAEDLINTSDKNTDYDIIKI